MKLSVEEMNTQQLLRNLGRLPKRSFHLQTHRKYVNVFRYVKFENKENSSR